MNTLSYFTASWCGPCRAFKPILTKVLKDYPEVKLDIIDIKQNQELTMEKQVRAVPTMLLGDERQMGALSEDKLRDWLDKSLKK